MAQAQAQAQQPANTERNQAGAKVTVACKLPAGLVIRGYVKTTEREQVLGGGTRDYDVWRWSGEEQEVFGPATPHGMAPKCLIVGGYALTHGVSKDLFDSWYAANKDGDLVKNRLIFAYERPEDAQAAAKDHRTTVSGFEPIDPDKPGLKVRGIEKATVK